MLPKTHKRSISQLKLSACKLILLLSSAPVWAQEQQISIEELRGKRWETLCPNSKTQDGNQSIYSVAVFRSEPSRHSLNVMEIRSGSFVIAQVTKVQVKESIVQRTGTAFSTAVSYSDFIQNRGSVTFLPLIMEWDKRRQARRPYSFPIIIERRGGEFFARISMPECESEEIPVANTRELFEADRLPSAPPLSDVMAAMVSADENATAGFHKKAAELYLRAAALGNVEAAALAGRFLSRAGEPARAAKILESAVSAGNPLGMWFLADLLAAESPTPANLQRAQELLKSAERALPSWKSDIDMRLANKPYAFRAKLGALSVYVNTSSGISDSMILLDRKMGRDTTRRTQQETRIDVQSETCLRARREHQNCISQPGSANDPSQCKTIDYRLCFGQ